MILNSSISNSIGKASRNIVPRVLILNGVVLIILLRNGTSFIINCRMRVPSTPKTTIGLFLIGILKLDTVSERQLKV